LLSPNLSFAIGALLDHRFIAVMVKPTIMALRPATQEFIETFFVMKDLTKMGGLARMTTHERQSIVTIDWLHR
jgi:hypothetical protein